MDEPANLLMRWIEASSPIPPVPPEARARVCQTRIMEMLFSDWRSILRILVIGTCGYVVLVALLRVFGKRAIAKFNAFDIVVTVAFGSAFATAVISRDVTLADGIVTFVLFLLLQRGFAGLAMRLDWFGQHVKNQPLLLIYRGNILWDNARREQLTELEVLGALRGQGIAAVADVLALVLEPDGSFSAIKKSALAEGQLPTTLQGVHGVPEFGSQE
ncbi:MAG TPA: YetF domain-containing protein [Vicinamibacterales bacterium]|nr:YetF domain-containing protein [Vicinamibacterales bacterium]